ncbi:MHC class II regulatory factor RFX1 isoform X1 [Hyla sarda]|uniref:MHC class II regulatory factor RFX1 isoform X1 n=1 Tax=Hyla sarda TaxID=327740 RepID=UPI0024C27EF6|nr:MHC class II regulatory factor RFX1 isoform X1 [Hyla sarda]
MATQAYVTELQATPPTSAQSTPQQYVAELQVTPPAATPQSAGPQTPAPQQYIVVTVSEGSMRGSDGELSPGGSSTTQTAVPTQVVQQVHTAQQRLLVQARVQPKVTAVSPLQLAGASVSQQRLVVQSAPKAAQVSLAVHTVQQPAHSPPESESATLKTAQSQPLQVHGTPQERSVVQATPQPQKSSPVHQLNVQGLQHVQGTSESSVRRFLCSSAEHQIEHEELEITICQSPLHSLPPMMPGPSSEWVDLFHFMPSHLLFSTLLGDHPEQRVKVQRVPQVLLFDTAPTALKVQQLPQVPVQHVYPGQVQYVEEGDATYTASSIRSASFPYTETPLYSQATGSTYYESQSATGPVSSPTSSPTVANSPSVPMYVSGGQILANATPPGASGGTAASGGSGCGTYVIQGGFIMGNAVQSYSHTTRASPATVQWLLDNYETAEGVSLPRSTLYCHYLLHCQEQKLEPVNAASFGKLIRSVFMGLRTRRLGTRGNSKYHYYGLRIKASSPLLRLMEDQQHLAMRQQPFSQKQRMKPIQKMEGMSNGVGGAQQTPSGLSDISSQVQQYQQFLDASRTLPEFGDIDLQEKPLPDGITLDSIKAFQLLYREHCEAIVDVVVNLQFTLVETLWKTFWRFNQAQHSDNTIDDEAEKRLPKDSLVLLSKYEPLLKWCRDCDHQLYQGLVETLIPDVLRPIPSALTQAIRNFAKSLESWLTSAMMNIPEEMVRIKVGAASAFAQTLRRYTSLNHLAQAARAVLQNTAQINQMLSDLNRVDFTNVQEQASWVCRCADRVVQRLEQDFKLTLQQQSSLEQWAVWLDGVVSQVLKPYQGNPGFSKAAKLFLLKWSFYSSMVIRDLTLRSAASFGSFHLIRLLYDEYMYYLIEHRVAQARGETPIAVMGEFANTGSSSHSMDQDKDEEEEEDDESDEDMTHELPLHSNDSSTALGSDSLEPPSKLARTDDQSIFVQVAPNT